MHHHIADYAVIGLGLIGSAALRYLSATGANIVGIGPAEPVDWKAHDGVFASHYDQGRITRVLDSNPDWADWAEASIAEYAGLEAASAIHFHDPVGCLHVSADPGAPDDTLKSTEQIGLVHDVDFTRLDSRGLGVEFPFLHFPDGSVGLAERGGAGYINPRSMLAAQLVVAANQGATIARETAMQVEQCDRGVKIVTDAGESYVARRALIAAGSWTNRLLERPFDLNILARTILLAELGADEVTRLRQMPSIITRLKGNSYFSSFYCLPPIFYPDGKHYLKIGGRDWKPILLGQDELTDWFHSDGRADAGAALQDILCALVPGLRAVSWRTAPCVYAGTTTGYPLLEAVAPNVAVIVGDNGAAAKSANEIGRRAAQMLMGL